MKTPVTFLTLGFTVSALAAAAWIFTRQPEPLNIPAGPSMAPVRAINRPPLARAPGPMEDFPELAGTVPPTTVSTPAAVASPAPSATARSVPEALADNGSADATAPSEKKSAPLAASGSTKQPKQSLQDPIAKEALALVGVDPEAEAYWRDAIFDSSLPDEEREDLMEDLNEDGLTDDKRPGPEDFPVIMSRLALIEEIEPEADDFMLPHLWEAYKDLLNLAEVSQGGGEPVK